MTTHPKIEEAARAVALAAFGDQSGLPLGVRRALAATEWPTFVPMVRAVLQAIREPTEEMVKIGADAEFAALSSDTGTTADAMAAIYTAMIDSLLEQGS